MARYLSPQQYAQMVGVSAKTIRKLCRQGKLPAEKIGSLWRIRIREESYVFDEKE